MFMLVAKGIQESDRCRMREEAAFNHVVVEAALHSLFEESIFLAASGKLETILLPFSDSLPRRFNSAPYAKLANSRSLLQSTPVHTFTEKLDSFALTR